MGNSSLRVKSQLDDFGPSVVANKQSSCNVGSGFLLKIPEDHLQASSSVSLAETDGPKIPTVFRWKGNGNNVYISGSYDNWSSKIPLVKSRQDLFTIVELPEGMHQYKYFVDGQWLCDEKQATVPNDFGTSNNVISVKPSDFQIFEALGKDCLETGHSDNPCILSSGRVSPPGDYCQQIPPKTSKQRVCPPVLPGHLLEIMLNRELSRHCEPVLLPEPNHVMMNHLYALSIKDGMMILSTTHRYRRKYITTILYRPM